MKKKRKVKKSKKPTHKLIEITYSKSFTLQMKDYEPANIHFSAKVELSEDTQKSRQTAFSDLRQFVTEITDAEQIELSNQRIILQHGVPKIEVTPVDENNPPVLVETPMIEVMPPIEIIHATIDQLAPSAAPILYEIPKGGHISKTDDNGNEVFINSEGSEIPFIS